MLIFAPSNNYNVGYIERIYLSRLQKKTQTHRLKCGLVGTCINNVGGMHLLRG